MIEQAKIEGIVNQFFTAYAKLSSDEKLYFLAAIDKQLKALPESDKTLYLGLLASARANHTPEQAISALKGRF